jgi:hypoxanthine phosphoribosyltransferase/ABC-type iron transport system FetAB permease component
MNALIFYESIPLYLNLIVLALYVFEYIKGHGDTARQLLFLAIYATLASVVVLPTLKNIIREPRPECNKKVSGRDPSECYGMPSAHAAIASLIFSYLFFIYRKNVMIPLGIIGTFLICYQRVAYRRHTVQQVIVGSMVGVLLAMSGAWLDVPSYTVLISISGVIAAYILYRVYRARKSIEEFDKVYKKYEFPEYLSPISRESLTKKVNTDNSGVYTVLSLAQLFMFRHIDYSHYKWSHIEHMLDKLTPEFKKYDKVVGILSGGAYLADYIGSRTGLPVGYLKISLYGNHSSGFSLWKKCMDVASDRMKDTKVSAWYYVDDVEGKRVLLVDDISGTGTTMRIGTQFLKDKGVKSVTTYAFSCMSEDAVDMCSMTSGVFCLPWGLQS